MVRFGLLALGFALAFRVFSIVRAEDTPQALQQQLKEIERQIKADQAEIKQVQGQAKTLANIIKVLGKQQSVLQLQIQSTEVTLNDVENRLQDTQIAMQANEKHRVALREQMGELIRQMNSADEQSLLYSFISSKNIFDVLNTIEQYKQLTTDIGGAVTRARETSVKLKKQETEFTLEQEEARNLQTVRGLQQTALVENTAEQKTLLANTKGQEAVYQSELGDHKAQAALIRNRIYELLDAGNTHITFGQAVKIADWVHEVTGIEPAFLLAVVSQESSLGANVGTCNRAGDPPSKNWKVVMKPTRDQAPFVSIMNQLGRSTEGTPISCPMHDKAGHQIGWGGAMGPAQFIPSTWTGYDAKISALTGKPADPWDIRDAFVAAALKLTADGASSNTDQGEWNSAMRYFSGSTNPQFRFYGDQVMTRTERYRADIKELDN